MKKYLIVGDGESPHILKWIKELSRYYEIYLVSSRGILPEIKAYIPPEKIFTFNLKISESGGNLKMLKMVFPLRKIIKRIKPDFVNAHYITSHGFVTALALSFSSIKPPLIQSAWGSDILVTPQRNALYKGITRFALKKAQLATADSPTVASIIGGLTGIQTMTFPFGLEKLPELTFSAKNYDLFFSNRTLNTNSNIDKVLLFFRKILDNNKNARLIIANDGPEKESLLLLRDKLQLQDNVKFCGFITAGKQADIYKEAGFYFSLLSSDALSVSLLEAMGAACIPLVSDLPDNRDWVTDGKNGIIIKDSTSYNELTQLSKSAEDIFKLNRELILQKAVFSKSIDAYISELKTLFPK